MIPVKPVILRNELLALTKSLLNQGLTNLIPLGGNLKRDLSDCKEPFYRMLPKVGRLQRDGSIKMVASWRVLVEQGPTTIEQVEYWLDKGATGLAAVCGGQFGLYVFDIDEPRFLDPWLESEAGEILRNQKAAFQQSGGGGYQVYVRVENAPRAKQLAWVPDGSRKSGRSIAKETRGEGNYIVLPFSLHPRGTYYKPQALFGGSFAAIPLITQEELKRLEGAARALCEAPKSTFDIEREERQRKQEAKRAKKSRKYKKTEGPSVIDRVNDTIDIEDALKRCGYKELSCGRWTYDDSNGKPIEIKNGRSIHYSTNDPLSDGMPKTPFNVICYHEFNDDVREAVKSLAEELRMDYASQREEQLDARAYESKRQKPVHRSRPAPPPCEALDFEMPLPPPPPYETEYQGCETFDFEMLEAPLPPPPPPPPYEYEEAISEVAPHSEKQEGSEKQAASEKQEADETEDAAERNRDKDRLASLPTSTLKEIYREIYGSSLDYDFDFESEPGQEEVQEAQPEAEPPKPTPVVGRDAVNVLPNGKKIGQVYNPLALYFDNIASHPPGEFDPNVHAIRKRIIEVSPTGTGKTWVAVLPEYSITLVPYRSLAISTAAGYQDDYGDTICVVMGGVEIDESATRFVCVYDSIDRLIKYLGDHRERFGKFWEHFLLTVDEWHQSVYSGMFRARAIAQVERAMQMFYNCRITTATPLPLMPGAAGFVRVNYERDVAHTRNLFFGMIGGSAKAIDQIIQIKKSLGEKPIVVLLQNSKKVNEVVKGQLEKLGYGCMHFNSDIKQAEAYQKLTETQELPNEIDVILATSLWQDGHNVFSDVEMKTGGRPVIMLAINNKRSFFGVVQIEQAASRIRDAKYIDVVLSMQLGGQWPTVEVDDKDMTLTGDKNFDIPAIFDALMAKCERDKATTLSNVRQTLYFYAGLDEEAIKKTKVREYLNPLGYVLHYIDGQYELEIDKNRLRTHAQQMFDHACWQNSELMAQALNEISQSVYHNRGMFALKTALTDEEKAEFKAQINSIKAENLKKQLDALEDFREEESLDIQDVIQNPDAPTQKREAAMFLNSCLKAGVEKESAIDHIVELANQRALNYQNVQDWLCTPARLMAIRRRAHGVEIDQKDAYRQLICRWQEGQEITNEMLIEWLEKHEGRILVKPSDDLTKRLEYARKTIKQAYGAKWRAGKFRIETLDPLPNLRFAKPLVRFPEDTPTGATLRERLNKLALWAPQTASEPLAKWLDFEVGSYQKDIFGDVDRKVKGRVERERKKKLQKLETVARKKLTHVSVAATLEDGELNIKLSTKHASQIAKALEFLSQPVSFDAPKPTKPLTDDEAKILTVIKREEKPLTAAQLRKATGRTSKTRMPVNNAKQAIKELLDKREIVELKDKRSTKYACNDGRETAKIEAAPTESPSDSNGKLTENEAKILTILKRCKEPQAVGQLRRKTGRTNDTRMSLDAVKQSIKGLVDKNRIIEQKEKRYCKYFAK